MPRKITPIDGAELRTLVQSGKTLTEIGALCGVGAMTVYRWTRLYGLRTVNTRGRKRTDPYINGVRRSWRSKPIKSPIAEKPVVRSAPSSDAIRGADPFSRHASNLPV